ncbi:MAG: site-specific integrase [Micromonosporaceae bacterium]|nr:site-specific integrase [Micromonosporaceae bacterium]
MGAVGVLAVAGRAECGAAAGLRGLLDPGFLAEAGWDAQSLVLRLPDDHRLLGRPVCRADGCDASARGASRICRGCEIRLARHGLGAEELGSLPARQRRGPQGCAVPGCPRVWKSSVRRLCSAHDHQRVKVLRVPLEEFVAHPEVAPLPAHGPCLVAACARQRRSGSGSYCWAHEQRWWIASKATPDLDEQVWRATVPASAEPGCVSLRGLTPLVVVQVLFGLQQRTRAGRKTNDDQLRLICNVLRRHQVTDLTAFDAAVTYAALRGIINTMIGYVRCAVLDPETERVKDVWQLAAFGHGGTLSFTGLSQPWLRLTAQRWAADDLPKRRGRRVGGVVGHHIGCLVRLSQSLQMRPDHGLVPAALGRADVENFLNRLAYQETSGQLGRDARIRTVQELKTVFARIRLQGLPRPGGPAAGLGEDFVFIAADIPPIPEREPGRDLPPEIMRQLCAHLPALQQLATREVRVGVELAIDTGRRPEEICDLAWDCLTCDAAGKPVLIYNNDKENRLARRLPIAEATADLITAQKQRVRHRYPHAALATLKLLPSPYYNPDGTRGIAPHTLSGRHREWVDSLPPLLRADGTEFDTAALVPYCYRHTYAQRHADAGIAVDVLQQLMDHTSLQATQRYYRVGEPRRREAVDRLAALQFDQHGNRVWHQAQALLDADTARHTVGGAVVPFGTYAERSHIASGGRSCPHRFRCIDCDHFRTDVSYLPDLQVHLDALLRHREQLHAVTAGATPAPPVEEDIRQTRRLINRVKSGLDQLTPAERAKVEHAVAVVRGHHDRTLGTPEVPGPLPATRMGRSA